MEDPGCATGTTSIGSTATKTATKKQTKKALPKDANALIEDSSKNENKHIQMDGSSKVDDKAIAVQSPKVIQKKAHEKVAVKSKPSFLSKLVVSPTRSKRIPLIPAIPNPGIINISAMRSNIPTTEIIISQF